MRASKSVKTKCMVAAQIEGPVRTCTTTRGMAGIPTKRVSRTVQSQSSQRDNCRGREVLCAYGRRGSKKNMRQAKYFTAKYCREEACAAVCITQKWREAESVDYVVLSKPSHLPTDEFA